jgi:hypothetical protein
MVKSVKATTSGIPKTVDTRLSERREIRRKVVLAQ